ncbi:hypothetical protein BD289DRAFT_75260 [Coniella lustricola]|uniref:Uncharacterized protein n=1 Tax=Coniella lustricola TaxID=2025994 RepID=A0A2T3AHQ4_9PEZI|nr:hypothetical protein BD289DRAFT_75260 [Coniella lustricola]
MEQQQQQQQQQQQHQPKPSSLIGKHHQQWFPHRLGDKHRPRPCNRARDGAADAFLYRWRRLSMRRRRMCAAQRYISPGLGSVTGNGGRAPQGHWQQERSLRSRGGEQEEGIGQGDQGGGGGGGDACSSNRFRVAFLWGFPCLGFVLGLVEAEEAGGGGCVASLCAWALGYWQCCGSGAEECVAMCRAGIDGVAAAAGGRCWLRTWEPVSTRGYETNPRP